MPTPGCSECDMADWCLRCEGISFTEEGELFSSSKELCRMAKIRKEADCEKGRKTKKKEKVHQARD